MPARKKNKHKRHADQRAATRKRKTYSKPASRGKKGGMGARRKKMHGRPGS